MVFIPPLLRPAPSWLVENVTARRSRYPTPIYLKVLPSDLTLTIRVAQAWNPRHPRLAPHLGLMTVSGHATAPCHPFRAEVLGLTIQPVAADEVIR